MKCENFNRLYRNWVNPSSQCSHNVDVISVSFITESMRNKSVKRKKNLRARDDFAILARTVNTLYQFGAESEPIAFSIADFYRM